MKIVTATQLKRNMKKILDQSIHDQEPVIIKRPHGRDMAIIDLAEYESLKDTACLLGNTANVKHLSHSIQQIDTDKVVIKKPDKLL